MYRKRTKHNLSKLDWVWLALHRHTSLKQSFRDKGVAVEAQGQCGDGIEHPSKNVVLLEEAPVLFKKLSGERAQEHRLRAPAREANWMLSELSEQLCEALSLA